MGFFDKWPTTPKGEQPPKPKSFEEIVAEETEEENTGEPKEEGAEGESNDAGADPSLDPGPLPRFLKEEGE